MRKRETHYDKTLHSFHKIKQGTLFKKIDNFTIELMRKFDCGPFSKGIVNKRRGFYIIFVIVHPSSIHKLTMLYVTLSLYLY